MAQHIIRDSKGRVEKILNDQEYAEYEKRGCYSNIIFWGVLIIGIFALIYFLDKKEVKTESTTSNNKIEVIDEKTPSQSSTVNTNSTLEETDINTDESTVEPTSEEYDSPSEPTFESTPSADEPEHKLSRKERRALRKAQKREKKTNVQN